jgi:hypothetical protein
MDKAGYHALACRHMGSFGVRHNALRDKFLVFLSQAGIVAEREAPSLLPGSAARPADIFVPNFAASQAACLDFAVTHTQQPNTLQRASVCGGAAAAQYEVIVKDKKFGMQCKDAGLILVPMVVEVFGTWGERSEEAFALVSKACGNRASETARAAGAHIRRSLSVCLQRLNARILLSHMNPLAEVFGEPLAMPSCPNPSQPDEVAARRWLHWMWHRPSWWRCCASHGQGGFCLRRISRTWAQRWSGPGHGSIMAVKR